VDINQLVVISMVDIKHWLLAPRKQIYLTLHSYTKIHYCHSWSTCTYSTQWTPACHTINEVMGGEGGTTHQNWTLETRQNKNAPIIINDATLHAAEYWRQPSVVKSEGP